MVEARPFIDYIWSSPWQEKPVRFSENIKPISYLKSEAAQVVKDLTESGEPLIITQNGEAKLVVMDVVSYESMQQTMAMLKLVSMARKDKAAGNFMDAANLFAEIAELDRNDQDA
jgi:prevent-host-death family protein